MSSIQTIITVNKPIKKTFDSFLDENFMAQWVSGFQKIEIIRGEPKQQHSKYILTLDFDGKLTAVTQEIVEIIDQQFIYIRMEHPDIITYSEISFNSTAIDSTKVHCLSKVMGKGFKIKMLMPVVKNILDSRQQRDYKMFRELLEVNAA
jgi:uncharacterized membrane protein